MSLKFKCHKNWNILSMIGFVLERKVFESKWNYYSTCSTHMFGTLLFCHWSEIKKERLPVHLTIFSMKTFPDDSSKIDKSLFKNTTIPLDAPKSLTLTLYIWILICQYVDLDHY